MLSECQKAQRVGSCWCFVQRFKREGEDFLSRIVTADEMWISLSEPESKEQSTMWKTPGSTSPKKSQSFNEETDVHHVLRHPRRHA